MIHNIKLFIFKASIGLLFIIILNNRIMGQQSFPSYQIGLSDLKPISSTNNYDCEKNNNEANSNSELTEFKRKPFFLYTTSDFNKWSDKKILMESAAHLYQIDKSLFLIISFKINSINARRSYGDLSQNAQMKIYLDNGDHIYLENIEKDKGKVNRSEGITNYKCILPINKSDRKSLQKNFITKVGIMWEEGYQEYEVHNLDLIKNQINCLNNN